MKNRHLLIPTTIVETIVRDLDDKEKLELINLIFSDHLGYEEPIVESRLVRITWKNLKPTIEKYKKNYEVGQKGGAPKGNENAKKKLVKTTETTDGCFSEQPMVELKTTLKDKDKDKDKDKVIDKDKVTDKDIDKILEKLYERNPRKI